MQLEEVTRMLGAYDALYGLELVEVGDGLLRGRVEVRDEVKQPFGLVHGGLYASIAESLASIGTAIAVSPDGRIAMGLSNQTSFLRPVLDGHVHARASALHRGRTTWVWDVDFRDDDDRACALTRMTIAVREPR